MQITNNFRRIISAMGILRLISATALCAVLMVISAAAQTQNMQITQQEKAGAVTQQASGIDIKDPVVDPSPIQLPTITLPSGYIPPVCYQYRTSEMLVDCWLAQYPKIANAIVWEFHGALGSSGPKAWPQWSNDNKQQLRDAFKNAALWYMNGMTNYPGVLAPDPAWNMDATLAMQGIPYYPVLTTSDAWQLYIGHVGLSLAAEIHSWVPWSLRNYDETALNHLFNAYDNMFRYDTNNGTYYDSVYPGYIIISGSTPTNAIYTFKFLKENDLIGATPLQTAARVLNWSRNLSHTLGSFSSQNMYYYWHHWGPPPISRIIEGTIMTDPEYAD